MLKYFRILVALFVICSVASCHKGDITLLTRQVATGTTYNLYDVDFVNDSVGYICGGSRYGIGIALRTVDGGKTWSAPDSLIPKALYAMNFFSAQEGLLGGFEGYIAYTSDSIRTTSVQQFDYLPFQHFSFIDRRKGVAVCGLGSGTGAVYQTTDGGAHWSRSYKDSMHAYYGAAYLDDLTVVVCGYGTILRSIDSGATFKVTKQNGDFYQDVKFVAGTGYAVGYQGEVIKSADAGVSWRIVQPGNSLFSVAKHLLAVDFIDQDNGYAVGEAGYMIHTSNGGQDWQVVKAFTGERLDGIHLFSPTSGIVVGANGAAYLFQE